MYKKILVPVSLEEDRNAEAALTIAALLSDGGGEITVLHVMEDLPGYATEYLPAGHQAASKSRIEADLKAMVGDRANVAVKVVFGHSARTILDYATDEACDCIVIASHKPGLQDYFLGSTAARVVRHAPCAVHVIR